MALFLSGFFSLPFLGVSNRKSRPGWKKETEKLGTCFPHYASSANESRHLNLFCYYQKEKYKMFKNPPISFKPIFFSLDFLSWTKGWTCAGVKPALTLLHWEKDLKSRFCTDKKKSWFTKRATAEPSLQCALRNRREKKIQVQKSVRSPRKPSSRLPGSVHACAWKLPSFDFQAISALL